MDGKGLGDYSHADFPLFVVQYAQVANFLVEVRVAFFEMSR